MFFLAEALGGSLAILLLSWLVEWAVCKRVMDNQCNGIVASIIAAWIIASILYGFGSSNGGSWSPTGFLLYGIGAVIVFAARLTRYHLKKDSGEDLADVFE